MTITTINSKTKPQAEIDTSMDGRIIVTVKGVCVDITYDVDGITAEMQQDGKEPDSLSADF